MKVKVTVNLEKTDEAKLKTVKEWLQRNGLPAIDDVQNSYIYRVGLDLSFNQATGALAQKGGE